MNLLVVAMSHLACGSTASAPPEARAGVPLSPSQWSMIEGVEAAVQRWCPFSLSVESLKCGRKGLELATLVRRLERACSGLGASHYSEGLIRHQGLDPDRGFANAFASRIMIPSEAPPTDVAEWLVFALVRVR